jgi:NADH:ubiquinone oxidoreductase subunit E
MDGLEQRINRAVRGQTQPTVTILSSLLAVEDELSYIPKEAVELVAEFIKATVNDVWAVASFYPNFRFDPPATHSIEVCWGTSCHLVGAMRVVKACWTARAWKGKATPPTIASRCGSTPAWAPVPWPR